MDHEQVLELIPGYLDQELSLTEARAFERHLDGCASCRRVYEQHRQVSVRLRQAALRVAAPEALEIRAALPMRRSLGRRLLGLGRRAIRARDRPRPGRGGAAARGVLSRWLPAAAVALSVMALSGSAGWYLSVPSSEARLAQDVVDNHIRSLQGRSPRRRDIDRPAYGQALVQRQARFRPTGPSISHSRATRWLAAGSTISMVTRSR